MSLASTGGPRGGSRLLNAQDSNRDGVLDRFGTLLANSGMHEANDLAAELSIALQDSAFWRASLDAFRAGVARYEELSRLIANPDGDRAAAASSVT